jgi:hypothetical protein
MAAIKSNVKYLSNLYTYNTLIRVSETYVEAHHLGLDRLMIGVDSVGLFIVNRAFYEVSLLTEELHNRLAARSF